MLTMAEHVAVDAVRLERKELFELVIALARFVAETHERGQTVDDLRPDSLELEVHPRTRETVVRAASVIEDATPDSPEAVLARSPEQLRDKRFRSARCDVYGAAVLMYRLAARKPPFNGETFHEMLLAIADNEAEPLERLRPDLGATFGVVVRRAMAADPALRYADGQELLSALEEAREAGPLVSSEPAPDRVEDARDDAPEGAPAPDGGDAAPDPADRMSGRWIMQLSLGFLVVIGLVAFGYQKLAPRRRVPQATSEAALRAAREAASAYRETAAPPASSAP